MQAHIHKGKICKYRPFHWSVRIQEHKVKQHELFSYRASHVLRIEVNPTDLKRKVETTCYFPGNSSLKVTNVPANGKILHGQENKAAFKNLLTLEVPHAYKKCKTKHGSQQSSLINKMTDHIQCVLKMVQLTDATDDISLK